MEAANLSPCDGIDMQNGISDGGIGFMEMGVEAWGRVADALEGDSGIAERLGLAICEACGDIHPAEEPCRYLCAFGFGPFANSDLEPLP